MQKHVNLVDLVESFPTIYYLEKLASMQPRTSLWKFGIWSHQDGNLKIWTGENSYSNSQISVGIRNLNCGASERVEDLDRGSTGHTVTLTRLKGNRIPEHRERRHARADSRNDLGRHVRPDLPIKLAHSRRLPFRRDLSLLMVPSARKDPVALCKTRSSGFCLTGTGCKMRI